MQLNSLNKKIKYKDLIDYLDNVKSIRSNNFHDEDLLFKLILLDKPNGISYELVYQFINDCSAELNVNGLGHFLVRYNDFKIPSFPIFLDNCYKFIRSDHKAVLSLLQNKIEKNESYIENLTLLITYILKDEYFNVSLLNFDIYQSLNEKYLTRLTNTTNIFNTVYKLFKDNKTLIDELYKINLLKPILMLFSYYDLNNLLNILKDDNKYILLINSILDQYKFKLTEINPDLTYMTNKMINTHDNEYF